LFEGLSDGFWVGRSGGLYLGLVDGV
jgi:hypothetical protein